MALVSTIIPVFNRRGLVVEAVQSVLDQTYRPIEIILVDDGSTDDTPHVLHQLAARYPDQIHVFRQPNSGPGIARETGRQNARGEFLQYLDSDDRLLPLKFERQVGALKENSQCDVAYCYTRYLRIGEDPHPEPWKGSGQLVDRMFPSFLNDRWWDTPTPLYRRTVCDAAGPWTDLRLEEDWEYDCRVAALGTRLVQCPEFLVEVRDHGGERLCRGTAFDPVRQRQRARSHRLIYDHARRSGIAPTSPEMQKFARKLFLLARQCGAAGLAKESQDLFDLARQAAGQQGANRLDFKIYRAVAHCLGWKNTGRLACLSDQWR